MTIRKRIKQKWHSTLGDFDFKKATYHPSGNKTFEVWHQKTLIGYCQVKHFISNKIGNSYTKLEITKEDNLSYTASSDKIGHLYCLGEKNGFPIKIISIDINPHDLGMVDKRKVILEKYPVKNIFISPGVFTRETL